MPDLPQPKVDVTSRETDSGHELDVMISRDNRGKSYTGKGTRDEAVKQVIDKVLADPYTGEWVPRKPL